MFNKREKIINIFLHLIAMFFPLIICIALIVFYILKEKQNISAAENKSENVQLAIESYKKIFSDGADENGIGFDISINPKYDYKFFYINSNEKSSIEGSGELIKISKNANDEYFPMMERDGVLYYHPITISLYALNYYTRHYYAGKQLDADEFFRHANKLLDLQEEDGSIRYYFPWKYYVVQKYLKPGWISCMVQGVSLSVFTRAYRLSSDVTYYDAAKRSFDFMIKDKEQGGCATTLEDISSDLKDYLWFEEYVSYPKNNYTLNGYLFALFGIHDLYELSLELRDIESYRYLDYWNKGLESLLLVLDKYDIQGFSSYDLAHITMPEYRKEPLLTPKYHRTHIGQLDALYKLTGNIKIMKFRNKLISTVL